MSKSLSRGLYLFSILLAIVGGLLLAYSVTTHPIGQNSRVTEVIHSGWLLIGSILAFASVLLAFAAWIGALIRVAQLGRWIWFVCLIVFSGIAMLLYIFFGPRTPTRAMMAAHAPPAGGFG